MARRDAKPLRQRRAPTVSAVRSRALSSRGVDVQIHAREGLSIAHPATASDNAWSTDSVMTFGHEDYEGALLRFERSMRKWRGARRNSRRG